MWAGLFESWRTLAHEKLTEVLHFSCIEMFFTAKVLLSLKLLQLKTGVQTI